MYLGKFRKLIGERENNEPYLFTLKIDNDLITCPLNNVYSRFFKAIIRGKYRYREKRKIFKYYITNQYMQPFLFMIYSNFPIYLAIILNIIKAELWNKFFVSQIMILYF